MEEMEVHNYGKCFHNKDVDKKKFPAEKYSVWEAMDGQIATYKFVLAIENTLCSDYISGKLGRGFALGMVPVVASWNFLPDYKKMQPNKLPHLDIMSFKTVKEVADKLKEIGGDEKLYSEYLLYRKQQPEEWPEIFRESFHGSPRREVDPALCKIFRFGDFFSEEGRQRLVQRKEFLNETCAPENIIPLHFKLQL